MKDTLTAVLLVCLFTFETYSQNPCQRLDVCVNEEDVSGNSANVTATIRTPDEIDDYYINDYDYELSYNVSETRLIKSDSLILPNPENVESAKYTANVDVLPKIELPDDSLADTDLRDHDFIDNLMYIYYGSHNKNGNSFGSQIIIVGAVLSCAAQLLTIFCALLRKNQNCKKEMSRIFLHFIGSSCMANLLFMLGVFATKSTIRCQLVALLLHYLHLVTAFWLLIYCYYIFKLISNGSIQRMRCMISLAYGLPLILVLISFLASTYETRKFCFVSVQKGMLFNYMIPVSVFIICTTVMALNGIRKINLELSKLEFNSSAESLNMLRNEIEGLDNEKKNDNGVDEEVASLRELKSCLKILSLVQTSYDVVWFVAVLAVENGNYSNIMPILFSISTCLLNWYIFAKSKSFLPNIIFNSGVKDINLLISKENEKVAPGVSRNGSSDNIPLLNSEATEMRELRHDFISTIST